MRLSEIQMNKLVWVSKVEESPLKPKLVEMGIIEDRALQVLFKAPFGDPIAVQVGKFVLSLRLDEANLIDVRY